MEETRKEEMKEEEVKDETLEELERGGEGRGDAGERFEGS